MTVRTEAPITVGPGDFFRTDRGVTWGIKVTATGGWSFVNVFTKTGDAWGLDGKAESNLDEDFDNSMKAYGNDVTAWYHGKLIPALNKWLKLLPAEGAEPPPATLAQQADTLVQRIKITRLADGTLQAE